MSKTFRSVHNDLHDMEVDTHPDGSVRFSVDADYFIGFCVSPSEAPALALAILEAAGYGEEVVTDGSPDGHIQMAKYYLYEGVKAHASITAEAEAQAKLEAEALELFNARQEAINSFDWEPYKDFANEDSKQTWLAVARRARELNKEEK